MTTTDELDLQRRMQHLRNYREHLELKHRAEPPEIDPTEDPSAIAYRLDMWAANPSKHVRLITASGQSVEDDDLTEDERQFKVLLGERRSRWGLVRRQHGRAEGLCPVEERLPAAHRQAGTEAKGCPAACTETRTAATAEGTELRRPAYARPRRQRHGPTGASGLRDVGQLPGGTPQAPSEAGPDEEEGQEGHESRLPTDVHGRPVRPPAALSGDEIMVNLMPRHGEQSPPIESDGARALRELEELREAQRRERLAALRARVDRAKRESARESVERESRFTGGPCHYCGASKSLLWEAGNPGRATCFHCSEDRWQHSDLTHKAIILNRIITRDWRSRKYQYGDNADRLIARTAFKFWSEVDGAEPGGWNRWAYLDLAAIRAAAAPTTTVPTSPPFEGGDPCPRCGCAYLFTTSVPWTQMSCPTPPMHRAVRRTRTSSPADSGSARAATRTSPSMTYSSTSSASG